MGQYAKGCYTSLIICAALVVFSYISGFLTVNFSVLRDLVGL
ncbi:hypothetical protein HNP89_001443 [Methanococcus maripaludis]|uniref:Uncharacterized protein n=1 Tax=Methanococcus maripaludis TaxID=39152 RepID=A0A7J9P1L9_METMI|nr:hypothetical protein [Methanococcus maripaludis]MBA2853467.1 hypothetical protein [Methanococcus maripaludis]